MAAQQQPIQPVVLQKPPGFTDPVPGPQIVRPPPRNRNNYPFRPRKRQSTCCRMCCCVFFIICLIILFVFIILAGVMYLWLEPKMPAFHLLSFKIPKFNVTQRDDGTYIDASTMARMEVKNPNSKLTYRYGVSKVGINAGADEDTDLGSTTIPRFQQKPKNTTNVKIETSVRNEIVQDGLGLKLYSEFRNKKMVVNVRVKTSVGVAFWGVEIGMLAVDVFCEDIRLDQIEDGVMPKCSIHTFKWISVN
ncbi:Late embryogenesis abundant (LEA) hydroxyproline-rich glycoprotein family [Euphorbia peplus]|nr:Late embryogenesis abundant (LEA) hydroxyproline-rich glycoprotein family [Euphorbia peplus]